MHNILIDKLVKDGSIENMKTLKEILIDMFEKLNDADYEIFENKLKDALFKITQPMAHEKVKSMKPYGERWNYEEIKDFIGSKGITEKCIEYYITMNMAINDYHSVAKMVEKEDDADFYFEIAKDFINDVDAKPYKVYEYFFN